MTYAMGPNQAAATADSRWEEECQNYAAAINRVQQIMEDRAEDEMRRCDVVFSDWCQSFHDNETLARLLSLASRSDPYAFHTYRDQLYADYTQYRIDAAQKGPPGVTEWDREMAALVEI